MREAAAGPQALVEGVFAGVAERRMADVVHQGQGLDQILVQPQGPADRAGDRRHFLRVREPRAMVVAHVAGEDLHLPAQAAEGARMHDPVAVALERPAIRMLGLGMLAAPRIGAMQGITGQQHPLALGGGRNERAERGATSVREEGPGGILPASIADLPPVAEVSSWLGGGTALAEKPT